MVTYCDYPENCPGLLEALLANLTAQVGTRGKGAAAVPGVACAPGLLLYHVGTRFPCAAGPGTRARRTFSPACADTQV
jgi:hypothetical protein